MKIHGSIDIAEGGKVHNLVVARGVDYPNTPDAGELFYHNTFGLCVYEHDAWIRVAESASAIQIVGTANQIVAETSANVTLALADNPVLPGTGSITLPKGPTEARSAAEDGKFRYNTELNAFEGYSNGRWTQFTEVGDELPVLMVRRTTTQALNTSQNALVFQEVVFSNTSDLSVGSGSNRIVINKSGLYAITYECECRNTTTANLDYFQIRINVARCRTNNNKF